MKKKNTEISVNTSAGAEKVERIERETEESGKKTVKRTTKESVAPKKTNKDSAKGAAALGGQVGEEIKRTNASSTDGKAEKESKQAKARVEAALERKEAQAKRKEERSQRNAKKAEARKKRMAEKKAMIEKRAAEKKARAEKHAAERKALAEKRKAQKEEKLRERAHAKANRNNESYKKKKAKAQNKSERRKNHDGENRNKGYGGWIAAVVSLGVVSLALATTVTVGAVEMNKSKTALMGAYRGTMYELTGLMENVDSDLDRVRISNDPAQQARILTDLLVQARLAELDLEKLPITAETDRNATRFINRTAAECERMLGKLRKGEQLSEKDVAALEKLYETNHAVRGELGKLVHEMTDKDLMDYVKDGVGSVKDAIDRIEKSTLEENMDKLGEKVKEKIKQPMKEKEGAGTSSNPSAPAEKSEKKEPHVEAAQAEELCYRYFKGYHIGDFQCIGETVTKGYEAYNIQGYDEKGNQLFAELSQKDGTLLRFDYYEECAGETFDIGNAERIAEEFLEGLGYDDMEAVRYRANGSTTDFTFVYEDDDVVYHPDEIRVKVCRTRGVVSGFDATKYLQNHRGRGEVNVKISLAQAKGKLREGLKVESARLAVVKTASGERASYEFLCSYKEESYFVFIDAVTGKEISIVNTKAIS